jgi:MYXO-CTERM domain-containing protein
VLAAEDLDELDVGLGREDGGLLLLGFGGGEGKRRRREREREREREGV